MKIDWESVWRTLWYQTGVPGKFWSSETLDMFKRIEWLVAVQLREKKLQDQMDKTIFQSIEKNKKPRRGKHDVAKASKKTN